MARQMKDSGVAWIGMMPDGWRIEKGKHVLVYLERPIKDTDSVVTCFRDGQVTLRSNRRELGFTVSLQEIGYKGVEPGDLVVHGMDGFAGSIGISDSRGKCSPVLNILDSEEDKTFLMYYLRMMAYGNVFLALSTGIRERTCDTNWNKLKELPYPVPGRDVQNMIASTLTSKCAEIDKVVEQTRATIEEYKKLKQAIITEAVTKGVRGPRPMKPSGVEWIGDIPEEWEVRKVSQFWKASKGPNAALLTSEYCGEHFGQYPVYSGQTENNGVMGMIDSYVFDFGEEGCLFSTTVGAKAMSVSCLYGRFSLSQNCMIMQPIAKTCLVRYYLYLFTFVFGYYRSLIPDYMQPSFRVKDFYSYTMLIPTEKEQQEIAAYLDAKCAEIDRIIEKKEQLIEELGSYKKSLIYEYVTGKKEVTA